MSRKPVSEVTNGESAPATAIKIVSQRYEEAVVTIRGITRLVAHRWGETAIHLIEAKQQNLPVAKGEARDPNREFNEALYVLSTGVYGFPAAAIKKALVTAAKRYFDLDKVLINGCLKVRSFDPTEYLPLRLDGEPKMRRDMVRLAGIGRTADVRYRPEFLEWEMDVPIRFNASRLSREQITNIFHMAGEAVGLGDGRVELGMGWGEFEVVSFQPGAVTVSHHGFAVAQPA